MKDVIFNDYSDEIMEKIEQGIEKGLMAVGMQAESNAKQLLTDYDTKYGKGIDTGRLRNSITFAVAEKSGTVYTYHDDKGNAYSETVGSVDDHEVYIGTAVEYAPYIEFGHHSWSGVKMLHDAAANYTDQYKNILQAAIQSELE